MNLYRIYIMPIAIASLISRRNFTVTGPHDRAQTTALTLGTSLFIIRLITCTKWAQEEISPVARSAISNFKTNPCLKVKARL